MDLSANMLSYSERGERDSHRSSRQPNGSSFSSNNANFKPVSLQIELNNSILTDKKDEKFSLNVLKQTPRQFNNIDTFELKPPSKVFAPAAQKNTELVMPSILYKLNTTKNE